MQWKHWLTAHLQGGSWFDQSAERASCSSVLIGIFVRSHVCLFHLWQTWSNWESISVYNLINIFNSHSRWYANRLLSDVFLKASRPRHLDGKNPSSNIGGPWSPNVNYRRDHRVIITEPIRSRNSKQDPANYWGTWTKQLDNKNRATGLKESINRPQQENQCIIRQALNYNNTSNTGKNI